MIAGYTPGGSPIFFGSNRNRKKTKGDKNTRFRCASDSCNNATTKNQANKNGGVCFACGNNLKGFRP